MVRVMVRVRYRIDLIDLLVFNDTFSTNRLYRDMEYEIYIV